MNFWLSIWTGFSGITGGHCLDITEEGPLHTEQESSTTVVEDSALLYFQVSCRTLHFFPALPGSL